MTIHKKNMLTFEFNSFRSFVMYCLYIWVVINIHTTGIFAIVQKILIPHSSACVRVLCICVILLKDEQSQLYIHKHTHEPDEHAKNYLVYDVICFVSISCIDFVIAFIESEK